MATNLLLFFQPIPFLWYKGLPPYDLATLVGIAIVGILCALPGLLFRTISELFI